MGERESQRAYYIDTNILVGLFCEKDLFHEYSKCVFESAKNSNIKLKVLPHILGEAIIVINGKFKENKCTTQELDRTLSKLHNIERSFPPLDLSSYDRNGFSAFFYSISGQYERFANEIQYVGVNDFLLLLATFADRGVRGAIVTESKLQNSPLIVVLSEIYGVERIIKEAPERIFSKCVHRLH